MTYVITKPSAGGGICYWTTRSWSEERPNAKEFRNKAEAAKAMKSAARTYNNMAGATVENDEELAAQ